MLRCVVLPVLSSRLLILALICLSRAQTGQAQTALQLEPAGATLRGPESQQQLLVTEKNNGQQSDATARATFLSSDPQVATVDAAGLVRPVGDGAATITATVDGASATIEVVVERAKERLPIHFANDVLPLLSRSGCNAGGCHAKQGGQNGFQLSLFGYDPKFDYEALAVQARGRRVFPAAPDRSLVLLKAANLVPHGGGRRFTRDSREYQLLRRWITAGLPTGSADDPTLVGIDIVPAARVLSPSAVQRVIVTATYSDGTTRDVTHLSRYTSNNEAIAEVDEAGRVQMTALGGEAAIMAGYMGYVATSRFTVPVNPALAEGQALLAAWPTDHFIDRLVAEKWRKLNLVPSAISDDSTFLRRATLDCLGRLPTVEEARAFLADKSLDKRARLIDRLLEQPEYADYWALKWADLLRINSETLGAKNAHLFDSWLRDAFRQNIPYDRFLAELITAQGSSYRDRATNFYKGFAKPNDLTIAMSQIFLGTRLECAQCHHHPYEKWGQEDFYGLAAFFPRLVRKRGVDGEELLYAGGKAEVRHPKSGEVVAPQVLGGSPLELADDQDRRAELAAWMTEADNPFVPRALVNRVWGHFLGRGLVEPIDDMRDTNPATNEELLDALAADFVAHRFDLKHLIRTIMTANVYALSSTPNRFNERDTCNYSRSYRKRLSAEVLLDAVCDVAGAQETFDGMPPDTRAVELWNNRLPSPFLDVFGRPERKTVCECERSAETSLGQVLHLMNAPLVNDKIGAPTGRAAQLAASDLPPRAIIEELYLAALTRYPTAVEMSAAKRAFAASGGDRRRATEDVLWALLNTAEFVLNH